MTQNNHNYNSRLPAGVPILLLTKTPSMTTSDSVPSGDLSIQILHALDKKSPLVSSEVFPTIPYQEVKSALDRLKSRLMITYEYAEKDEPILQPEAEQIVAQGSHEARVFEAVSKAMEGLTIQGLEAAVGDKGVTKVGQGKALKEKWITKGKDGKLVANVRCAGSVTGVNRC